MIALDTNVLVRLLVRDDAAQAEAAEEFVETLTAETPGFVSLVVLAELAWVLRRSYQLPRERLGDVVQGLLDAPQLEVEDEESVSRALVRSFEGADLVDALVGDTAELHGCTEVVTFDRRAAGALGWRLLTAR